MQYQEFGKTGLRVSKLCLGTWGIGGAGWDSYSDESRMDAIKAALECGINFIDTAPAYNAGKAECYVGETLSKLKKRREVVISTKCGNKFVDGKYLRCGSKESILKQCDESLKNLKTDYIDIYLVHWPDPDVELEETIDAVSALKKEGKILHAGVSNFSKEQIEKTKIIQEKMLYDLSKHYTIRELCQEKRLSETIFKECFKAIYQQTPYNFLRMAKMNKAAELLRGKKITVAEVARELGYENPSNFTRTFKAMFGVLPKAYKENN